MEKSIFKAYDIRGVYPKELNEEDVDLIVQTYLILLSEKLNKPIKELKIAVGRDIRNSSESLIKPAINTFLKYGVSVDDYGLISINDYYFVVGKYKYDAGVMATASHNPPEYGGFKLTYANQEYPDSIDFLSGKELYQTLQKLSFPINAPQTKGKLNSRKYIQDHLKHIFEFVDIKKIKPFQVVVDNGNGMNSIMMPHIFDKLPCELIHLFPEMDGDFPNRPPNPLTEGAYKKLADKVLATKADLGIIYDVDGDRIFLVDEKGGFIRGDTVLLFLARAILKKNPGSGIAYNLICSHAVPELIAKWGGKPLRSEVGYRNVARHMREGNGIMSGEVSGHFAFRDNFYADSGFIALLLVLQTLSEDGRPLSEIVKDFSLYYKDDEINLTVDNIKEKLDLFRQKYKDNIKDEMDGITVEFDNWWFNVRASNTEPLLRITVEADNKQLWQEKSKELIDYINN